MQAEKVSISDYYFSIADRKKIENTNDLLHFIPHSTETLLNNQYLKMEMLKLLNFLVREAIDSIRLFYIENQFSFFDPHIGDCLCQIRAYKFAVLFLENKFSIVEELNKLKNLKTKITDTIKYLLMLACKKEQTSKYCKELDSSDSLNDFLNKYKLVINIHTDLIFLIQSKIITDYSKIDTEGISRGIDYSRFSLAAKLQKSLVKRIIHYYQQSISKMSCDFVFNLTSDISEENILKNHMYRLLQIDSDKRYLLPCYEVTKVILKHMLRENYNLLLTIKLKCKDQVEQLTLPYIPNKTKTDFILFTGKKNSFRSSPTIIVRGSAKTETLKPEMKKQHLDLLLSMGIYNILLANMASHPQYASLCLNKINENVYSFINDSADISILFTEYEKMKAIARTNGCCIYNPTLFLVEHIYFGRVEEVILFDEPDRGYAVKDDRHITLDEI